MIWTHLIGGLRAVAPTDCFSLSWRESWERGSGFFNWRGWAIQGAWLQRRRVGIILAFCTLMAKHQVHKVLFLPKKDIEAHKQIKNSNEMISIINNAHTLLPVQKYLQVSVLMLRNTRYCRKSLTRKRMSCGRWNEVPFSSWQVEHLRRFSWSTEHSEQKLFLQSQQMCYGGEKEGIRA